EDEQVLIPDLLEVSEPSFTFDDRDALRFLLEYKDFLPPSVMPRFIVKRHKEIKDRLRWRTGVVLAHAQLDAEAVVRADNEARQIHIAVTGRERKVYLALIWLCLREIHAGFEGLKVSERVPLPDDPKCSVPYENLLKYREQGMDDFIPECADKKYSALALLNSIHPDSQSDGEKMLALAESDKEVGVLRRVGKGLNRYVEADIRLFGLKFNYKNLFDDILSKGEK
ncbi:MAG: hypothetical protein D3916_15180, partial [Candidatus Electrothrix sp. MAN1_4]|nr:hypothetical protein [Candidatus Electrothrix sp. MAN1_4]